jgi:hypothetical protein
MDIAKKYRIHKLNNCQEKKKSTGLPNSVIITVIVIF